MTLVGTVLQGRTTRAGEAAEAAIEPPAPPGQRPPERAISLLRSARRHWPTVSVPFWVAVSRLVLGLLFAHLVVVLLPQSHQHLPGGTLNRGTWLGSFERWDSAYYLLIAQHGYPHTYPAGAAFFPGYPIVVALVHGLTFGALGWLGSAIAVSWAAFVAGAVVLHRLAARLYSPRVALVAVLLFCWVPTSLFFLAPYSEALFALEIAAVLALLERERFWAAAGVAAFASATSPESVALTLAIVVAAVIARRGLARIAGYAVVSGIGIAAYACFLWARFGDPFEYVRALHDWRRSQQLPFVGLYRNVLALKDYLVGPGPPAGGTQTTWSNLRVMWILDDLALVVATALVVALAWLCVSRWPSGARRAGAPPVGESAPIPVSFVVVSSVIVGLAACTTITPYARPVWASSESLARYVSVAMPLYVGAALLIRRSVGLVVFAVGACAVAALLFQAMYNLGYWVT
jgi:hypothetical protein